MCGVQDELRDLMVELLNKNAARLRRDFSVVVEDGSIVALPDLLSGHRPNADDLPELLLSIAADVDWADEVAACRGVAEVRRPRASPRSRSRVHRVFRHEGGVELAGIGDILRGRGREGRGGCAGRQSRQGRER